jgi:predicted dehydrogenase
LEALFVCVPPFAHADVEILAAGRGLHLYIEKPVALDMKKGLEILEAIERAGVISCVGYQLRYLPAVQAGRDFLAGKQAALVVANRWGGIPGGPDHWWRRMELSGGMVHEMATHNLDFLRYTVGDVVRVSARYGLTVLKEVENLTVPDSQALLLEFASGAVGCFSATCALTAGGGYTSIDIILRDVQVRLGFDKVTLLPEGRELALPPQGPTIHQSFIHAVRTGDRAVIRSSFRDALKTAEVTLGANESARTGRSVAMKLA